VTGLESSRFDTGFLLSGTQWLGCESGSSLPCTVKVTDVWCCTSTVSSVHNMAHNFVQEQLCFFNYLYSCMISTPICSTSLL
jgi:hypothetical protein